MNNTKAIAAIGFVVVTLIVLGVVIMRSMGSSAEDTKGLVPAPRAGSPTFDPQPVTTRSMPTTDTPQATPTGKLKNIPPPATDTQ